MPIVNRIADLHAEITDWRRDLHAHPELLFDVHRTAATVADKLKAFGCDEVVAGIGRTGVVGVIKGRAAPEGGRRTIGLRADMDALPIEEATGRPYASTNPGKMHACGHDGHTAMLLGAAKYLAETRNFAGEVAAEIVGRERVNLDVAPVMGAEDFSYMLEARPGAFIFVGNGDSAGLHHPAYDFNDEVIPIGTSYWVRLVETALAA